MYLHIFNWPENGRLSVPFTNKITKAYLLADAKNILKVSPGKSKSVIQLPSFAPDRIASVVAVEFTGEPVILPIPSLRAKVTATSSSENSKTSYITDGDPGNRWQAAKGEKSVTLEIDLGEPVTIQCLSLAEPWHPWNGINQRYELQYHEGTNWITIINGETNGSGMTRNFVPVTAQRLKLVLQNEKEAPSLNELILYRAE